MATEKMTRRRAVGMLAAGLGMPGIYRAHVRAPSETLYHASIGAGGMAWADIQSLTVSPHLKLVAVADVDLRQTAAVKKRFPDARIYQDGRELLDNEKQLDSMNVSTPDHMHGYFLLRAIERGLHVYGQKPLTQTIEEARLVAEAAARRRVVTQMGIQIHSHPVHRQVVATIQDRAIGRVKEVHSWSGKDWGDRNPRPERSDPVPAELRWDSWLGVAKERPYLEGYYHPGNWRKRLDFGTGTFGDMACHILDPVFTSLELRAPLRVKSKGEAPGADSWALDAEVEYLFPGTKHTAGDLKLCWYNGGLRPPAEVKNLLGELVLAGQGTIYIGTEGVLYSPYIDAPVLLPEARFEGYRMPDAGGADHYLQYVEACRGNGAASAPFSFAGPMTEAVLLGCLATRFPGRELSWDAAGLRCPGVPEADGMIRRVPRAGWEFPKIS